MKKALNKNTNKKGTVLKAAREEKFFPASDIIEELLPLLSDYFEGKFLKTKDKILMSFYNGQKFELTITEVK